MSYTALHYSIQVTIRGITEGLQALNTLRGELGGELCSTLPIRGKRGPLPHPTVHKVPGSLYLALRKNGADIRRTNNMFGWTGVEAVLHRSVLQKHFL